MYLFFVFFVSFCFSLGEYQYIFRGNWSGSVHISNNETVEQENTFHLYLEKSKNISGINAFGAHAEFKNASLLKFPASRLYFFGYSNPSNTSFFLFNLPKYHSYKLHTFMPNATKAAAQNGTDFYNFSSMHYVFQELTNQTNLLSFLVEIHNLKDIGIDDDLVIKPHKTFEEREKKIHKTLFQRIVDLFQKPEEQQKSRRVDGTADILKLDTSDDGLEIKKQLQNFKLIKRKINQNQNHVNAINRSEKSAFSILYSQNQINPSDDSQINQNQPEIQNPDNNMLNNPSELNKERLKRILRSSKTFDMDIALNGTFINNPNKIVLYGLQFDHLLFVSEGKILGVITSFQIILSYFAWTSLIKNFKSLISYKNLSLESFIMHIGFDFSYTLFIFSFAMEHTEFVFLFSFIFVCMISLYFSMQLGTLGCIWRASNHNLHEMSPEDVRFILFRLFTEVSFFMCLCSLSVSTAFEAPIICLPFLYSFFLPQIIHSAYYGTKGKKDTAFVNLVALQRLCPVWYFAYYEHNLVELCCPKIAYIVTCYVVLQTLIIHMQNKFGGSFFLPKRFQPEPFNYHSVVNDGEEHECAICMGIIDTTNPNEIMVTPCHHVFHTGCLLRWMDEQMICPICRASIPPL